MKFLMIANLLLLIQKEALTSVTSFHPSHQANRLQEYSAEADIFTLQIQQIRLTSEATPAVPDGNNLNVVVANVETKVPENFQAISAIYSTGSVKNGNKYKKLGVENKEVIDGLEPGIHQQVADNLKSVVEPLGLVWDNCLETFSKDDHAKSQNSKHEHDMESTSKDLRTEVLNKRNVDDEITHDTALRKNWLNLDAQNDAKYDERRQQKTDTRINKKAIDSSMITTEITEEPSNFLNRSINIDITEHNIEAIDKEDWYERKDETKIRFGGLPERDSYLIPSLRLQDGFYPFRFMTDFFSLIHPFNFPIGLIKDIVWGHFTFPYSFIHSIKVESTFLIFIITFACIALIIPVYLLVTAILSLMSHVSDGEEVETGALFPDLDESDCNDKAVAMITLFVVLICCLLLSGMAISNEQASLAATEARNTLNCACADTATFLAAAARELYHSLIPPVDMVLQAFKDDLRNIDPLLGNPIQKTIASESGIDLVLDSLNDVVTESDDISSKISSLRDTCVQAGSLASTASDRLNDLARQLNNLKKHCTGKDVKLCDTVNGNSLELRMKFDLILHEQQLLELRSLGVENLTRAISATKQHFRTLPEVVAQQTSAVRHDILRVMEVRKETIYRSSRILSDIVRHLTASLHSASRTFEAGVIRFQNYDFWRWSVMLGSILTFGISKMLILFAMLCGCGKAKAHAGRTLKFSTIWTCLASLILWSVVSAIFLIAGHAEVYACHSLWDSPQYVVISNLLDKPSPLMDNGEGVFDVLFRDMENVTIDVSIRDVLRECEKDYPAYNVFQLDKVLDVNKETSYFEWEDLQNALQRLPEVLDINFLKTISKELNEILNKMLLVSNVDLAEYRMDYNGPVLSKDLISLEEQLRNIAAQVTDLPTSGRLEALASRTQRLHVANVKILEQYRADIVFKLTELELQLLPFRRKLNISLSHIHTAQYYIDNQGDVIAQKKVSIYLSRLVSHVAGWRTHVLSSAATQAAKCRPLFVVFDAARTLLCSRYVASLHGWWCCGLLLGLSWCGLTPLCVKLWRVYDTRLKADDSINLANLGSRTQETPTTAVCENSNWNTPGPPQPPPRSDSW